MELKYKMFQSTRFPKGEGRFGDEYRAIDGKWFLSRLKCPIFRRRDCKSRWCRRDDAYVGSPSHRNINQAILEMTVSVLSKWVFERVNILPQPTLWIIVNHFLDGTGAGKMRVTAYENEISVTLLELLIAIMIMSVISVWRPQIQNSLKNKEKSMFKYVFPLYGMLCDSSIQILVSVSLSRSQ